MLISVFLSTKEEEALNRMVDETGTFLEDLITLFVREGLSDNGYIDMGYSVSGFKTPPYSHGVSDSSDKFNGGVK